MVVLISQFLPSVVSRRRRTVIRDERALKIILGSALLRLRWYSIQSVAVSFMILVRSFGSRSALRRELQCPTFVVNQIND